MTQKFSLAHLTVLGDSPVARALSACIERALVEPGASAEAQ